MKIKKDIFSPLFCILLTLLFHACSSDDHVPTDTCTPLVLSGKIFSIQSETATVWSGGQNIGIYLLKSGTQTPSDGQANLNYIADNRGTTGYLVPANSQTVYLPQDGSSVDIRAYYPYDADAAGNNHTTTVTIGSSTKGDSFLYSDNCTSLNNANNKGTVQLKSILSQADIRFECSVAGAAKINIVVKDAATQATFDLLSGQYLSYGSTAGTSFSLTSTTFNQKIPLLPGNANSDATLTVTVRSNSNQVLATYAPVSLHKVLELEESAATLPNTNYNILMQLGEGSEVVSQLTGTSSICILNWSGTEENPDSGIARPDK